MTSKKDKQPQDIEQLKARHKELSDQRVAAQTELKSAEKTLKELKAKAKQEYGTDDADELAEKLEAMKQENENRRAAYEKSLDQIETELSKVEKEYEEVEGEE